MKRYNGKWIYIDYLCPSESGKTKVYQVMSKQGEHLGDIKWFARWRGYAFYPEPETVYEQDCLKDIAKFLEEIKR